MKRFIVLVIVFLGIQPVNGQVSANLRHKILQVDGDTLRIDSLSIIPGTLSIPGVSPLSYSLDEVNAFLVWKTQPILKFIELNYRVFPFRINAITQRFRYDSIRYNFALEPFVFRREQEQGAKIFDFGNITYNGSFGRGIAFGNNQDAVVNSSMNLQLNGFLGDSLELTAVITDNSIPIQPDGNTQDLRDFDKVLVQVKKKGWELNFGDIDIRQSGNYFLNFYKRLQGASFLTTNKIGKDLVNSLQFSGAIAKGKFTRHEIIPLEGNQGPYRLVNPDNQIYFIVLANTERVFINGELLTRGEDQDYVINYNTAELTFTPRRLITKDTRIQVEFEYADRNYLNSQVYAFDEIQRSNKFKLSFGIFSNVDAKNSSINQELDSKQKLFLASIGDNIDSARVQNSVRDTFASNKILYKRIDTVYNGTRDSIFIYSTDPNDSLYSLSFLYVGPGKGNYTALGGNANGRVFQWLQPDANGMRRGEWEPVTLLITPKKLQLFNLGAEYRFSQKTILRSELAMSNYDVNTFSSKDKGNDKGLATRWDLEHLENAIHILNRPMKLRSSLGYEYEDKKFRPLERLRSVEFNRDWSLPYDAPPANEQLVSASIHLLDSTRFQLKYDLANYHRSDNFTGMRHALLNSAAIGNWRFFSQVQLTRMNSNLQQGNYFRPDIQLRKFFPALGNLEAGISYSAETNKQRSLAGDSLTPFSFAFKIFKIYLQSAERAENKWAINYFTREDKIPIGRNLITTDRSKNLSLSTELLKNEHRQLKTTITYRSLSRETALASPGKLMKPCWAARNMSFQNLKACFPEMYFMN